VSRGSIIKRGSTYSIVLDLGHGPDGRRVRRWHSGYRTKKDAERARTELLARSTRAPTLSRLGSRWPRSFASSGSPGWPGGSGPLRCTAIGRTWSGTSSPALGR
jgi:Arm DNA-binding domain